MHNFNDFDQIINKVDLFVLEPSFSQEKSRRLNKLPSDYIDDRGILRLCSYLIAFSQNSNSELVDKLIKSGNIDKVFQNFEIDEVIKMNPCDIVEQQWDLIKVMRQQGKIFHIIMLARKIKKIGNLSDIFNNNRIPKRIESKSDIEEFWKGFNELQNILKDNKIPFFQSTTSLLHFLLESGYDCVKPDLVVMKVGKKLGIVESVESDENLRTVVRTIQEYSLDRGLRPSVVDLYFLIDEGQKWAKNFVRNEFYK
jgi:3-methyladenine DNA glycosylase Tag